MRAVDIISAKNRNRIGKLANGARIAPGIPHVPGIRICPYHARIPGFFKAPCTLLLFTCGYYPAKRKKVGS